MVQNGKFAACAAAVRVSAARKIQEIKYAVTLEKEMTKDQILEGYLNLAYYGDLAYGIEAAAQHYFSVPASKLNLPQAATLAGLVQNPSRTDPFNNPPERAQARRNVVLDRTSTFGNHTSPRFRILSGSKIYSTDLLTAGTAWSQSLRLNIPTLPAATGIAEFARQTGAQVLVLDRHARGKTTHALIGDYTVAAGLTALLEGTGLEARPAGANTWTIVPALLPSTA